MDMRTMSGFVVPQELRLRMTYKTVSEARGSAIKEVRLRAINHRMGTLDTNLEVLRYNLHDSAMVCVDRPTTKKDASTDAYRTFHEAPV
jgi:hypothetical protein